MANKMFVHKNDIEIPIEVFIVVINDLLINCIALNIFFSCFVGWIYDITQKYDFSFYICGLLYMIGILFLLIQPCIQIIEQSRRKYMHGAHAECP